tara:strand:- start:3809 stop:4693 length:885 start_codon:yes stop_codon:yes gene_type:complete
MTTKWTLDKFKYKNKKPPYKKVCFGIRGQYGDILMQEPALRKFIKDNPDTKIVLAASKKFEQVLPLFENYHENIIDFKIFDGYGDWPTIGDKKYINTQDFDAMFPPDIPLHKDPNWAKHRHIVYETALMMGVEADSTDIQLKIPSEVVKESKSVALHLFSSKWPGGTRSINIEKQTKIVAHLMNLGYKVYQLSSPNQPHIENTIFEHGTYYEACLRMLSTDLLISCDSGMAWVSSAYNHPTIALFSTAYNPNIGTTENWHPTNPNGSYFEAQTANEIPTSDILKEVDNKLGIGQ